jgi:glycosyltransferase involved in cell wall biosynthesis
MKIALYNLTTTTAYGGVESFVWDLANQLSGHGHDVHVWGGHGTRRAGVEAVGVHTYPFIDRKAFSWIPGLRRAYAERKLLERLSMALTALPALIRQRYDIIHIQKPYDLLPALIAGRLSGAKVILGCHGEDFYRGDQWLARRVAGAVSCSRFNADTVMRRYPIDVEVVYNGIDTTLFHPKPMPSTTTSPMLRLLFVGRLQPWKGVDTAVRAVAQSPMVTLTIAGDGVHRAELEALVEQLNVRERVHFLGSVERNHMPDLMHQHDLLVATSHASETFGIGLVEAQACGLPVIASRFGGFVEVVNDGQTGLFFTPRDHHDLARQIRVLHQDRDLRARMAAAAPAWAAQFAWPRVTDHIETYYQQVLETARKG